LREVPVKPLTAQAFAPFGDVIDITGHAGRIINRGTSERFDDLARLDLLEAGGFPTLNVYRARGQSLPLPVAVLERHPLSSQSFYPLEGRPFLVIVAEPGECLRAAGIRAFVSNGHQGINYRRDTWHHALVALAQSTDFLVIERGGPGDNCIEATPDDDVIVTALES
jgi:ureidoglycolate lyase